MGLGPPVCEDCWLIGKYNPNVDFPEKQGKYICENCGESCESSVWIYPHDDQCMIMFNSKVSRENRGHDVS